MKHPLLFPTLLLALLILLGEQFFGCFSHWCDPARDADHYCHFVCDSNYMLARVSSIPSRRAKTFRIEADVFEISDSAGRVYPCTGKILYYLPYIDSLSSSVTYGDTLMLKASAKLPSTADSIRHFDYRKYLFRKGILYTAYVPPYQFRIVGRDDASLSAKITALRLRLIETIGYSSLSPSQQAIAETMFLGWNEGLDSETRDNFRAAGISHLLCVSGLHVGIVAMLAGYCLAFLGNRRRSRIIRGTLQLAIVWLFVLLTQMAPATLRAAIMFTFIIVGQMFFSKPATLNAIAASALVLLVVRPLLLFDIGFQLSYCAVTAIVLFVRPMEALLPLPDATSRWAAAPLWIARKIWSLLCVSLVAQIALLPLILYHFHNFPTYFLVANMVVVPFAAILLGGIIVMVLLSWWPWAFATIAKVMSLLLAATERLTATIASWPYAMIEDIRFDTWMLIISSLIVAAIGWALLHLKTED